MKHPLSKFSKKNRNIISGILCGIASIYAVASFYDVPQSEINSFFLYSAALIIGIMLLAIVAVVIIKGLAKLVTLLTRDRNK